MLAKFLVTALMTSVVALVGSFLLDAWTVAACVLTASLFVVSGVRQAQAFAKIRDDMGRLGAPMASLALGAGIALELIAGAALATGVRVGWSALVLIVFTVLSTLIYYRNWRDRESFVPIVKNLAIVGGLLLVLRGT